MFDIEKFRSVDFEKSTVEDMRLWYTENRGCTAIGIDGKFFDNRECPFFSIGFDLFPEEFEDKGKIIGAELINIDLTEIKPQNRYSVKIAYTLDGKSGELVFSAKNVSFTLMKYRGMSYRNMYDEYLKILEKNAYVESEEFLRDDETHELEDGYTVNVRSYADIEQKNPQYMVTKASMRRCELFKDGETVYHWADTDGSNPHTFFRFIQHSSGHRYFPFHIELYGISYLDIDSGEVYHYVPEGYQHNAEWAFGESFIVTNVHYDKKTDLVAYEGCYWGGSSDVMVGDLSDPLDFDPHLVSVHNILDPEWEELDDVDFARFENGDLIVKDVEGGVEKSVSCEMLLQKIKEIK